MTRATPPDPGASLSLVPRALLSSSVAILAVAAILNSQGRTAGGPEALSWLAVGWALLAPLVAVAARGRGLVEPAGHGAPRPEEAGPRLRRTIVFFALLESAALLAGVAAMVSPPGWPLAAALVPVGVMVLNLPPRRG